MCLVKSPEALVEELRSRGLKATPQRLCVFKVLQADTSHPSAESVYAAVRLEMPTISLRTVYQALNDLAEMGEIGQLDLGTGSARFDPNLARHHHLVCQSCGRVQDVEGDFDEIRLPDGLDHGFEVSATEIVFRGRCPSCKNHTSPHQREVRAHG